MTPIWSANWASRNRKAAGKKLVELIMQPSLNVRGLRSAYVGEQAQNVVPDRAEASLDARLVKGEDPQKKFEQIVAFIRKQGYFVVDREPTMEERRTHALIAKVVNEGGYRASRTPMDLPVSKALVRSGARRDGRQHGDHADAGWQRADVHFRGSGIAVDRRAHRELRQSPAQLG